MPQQIRQLINCPSEVCMSVINYSNCCSIVTVANLVQGKLELEFEILTEEESKLHPAAKARDKPNQNPKLDPPNRPVTSFLGFISPLKAFDILVWKRYKKRVIIIAVILFIIVFIAMLL